VVVCKRDAREEALAAHDEARAALEPALHRLQAAEAAVVLADSSHHLVTAWMMADAVRDGIQWRLATHAWCRRTYAHGGHFLEQRLHRWRRGSFPRRSTTCCSGDCGGRVGGGGGGGGGGGWAQTYSLQRTVSDAF
jgi:uncharacterized membrane protein YgcG